MHDQLVTDRRFRVLNIVDDVTRECLRAVSDSAGGGSAGGTTQSRAISCKRVVRA